MEIADLDEMDKTTRRGLVEMRRKLNIKAGCGRTSCRCRQTAFDWMQKGAHHRKRQALQGVQKQGGKHPAHHLWMQNDKLQHLEMHEVCFQSASIAEKHKLWDETWCESSLEGCNKRKHNNMMERRVQEGELAESVEMHGIFLDSGKNMAQSLIGDLTRR